MSRECKICPKPVPMGDPFCARCEMDHFICCSCGSACHVDERAEDNEEEWECKTCYKELNNFKELNK